MRERSDLVNMTMHTRNHLTKNAKFIIFIPRLINSYN